MQRRIALALAFACTVVVVFALFAMGRQAGFFGGGTTAASQQGKADSAGPDDVGGALRYLAAVNQPAPTPGTVTEYVYVDVPGSPQLTYVTRSGPSAPATNGEPQRLPTVPPGPAPTQAPPPTAVAPTSVPPTPAPRPTSPAPSPVPTSPPPAAPPSSGTTEFTGTVASVDGNVVVFTHNGTSTPVTVSSRDLTRLQPGVLAHVHARASGGVWVAEEIEVIKKKSD
jgi:hypothetical protein